MVVKATKNIMGAIHSPSNESCITPPLTAIPFAQLHSWNFSSKRIMLKQKGEDFYYQIFDRATGGHAKRKKISFGMDNHTTEERARHLVKCYPTISESGKVEFVVPFACQKKQIQGFKVKLFLVKEQKINALVWQILDSSSKSYFYSFNTISITQKASSSTLRFFKNISSAKEGDVISSLAEEFMDIVFVGKLLDPKNVNLAEFRLRPKAFQTQIDDRVSITRMTWAAVMVAYQGTPGLGQSCDQNHAQVIVEGVHDKGQFAIMFHHDINGVEVENLTHKKINYYERTIMWKVSARKAEKMINAAKKNALKCDVPFNMCGPYSLINNIICKQKGENCFTYSRKMLKMVDVNIKFDPTYFIVPRTRNFTKKPDKFKKLTDSCNAPHEL